MTPEQQLNELLKSLYPESVFSTTVISSRNKRKLHKITIFSCLISIFSYLLHSYMPILILLLFCTITFYVTYLLITGIFTTNILVYFNTCRPQIKLEYRVIGDWDAFREITNLAQICESYDISVSDILKALDKGYKKSLKEKNKKLIEQNKLNVVQHQIQAETKLIYDTRMKALKEQVDKYEAMKEVEQK